MHHPLLHHAGLILGLRPANEKRRYFVTTSLIGWVEAMIQPCHVISVSILLVADKRINNAMQPISLQRCAPGALIRSLC